MPKEKYKVYLANKMRKSSFDMQKAFIKSIIDWFKNIFDDENVHHDPPLRFLSHLIVWLDDLLIDKNKRLSFLFAAYP